MNDDKKDLLEGLDELREIENLEAVLGIRKRG